jgi:Tol biopolymer transport system component
MMLIHHRRLAISFSTALLFATPLARGSDVGMAPSANHPAVSRDGSRLVFVADVAETRDLWIPNANGANAAVLTPWPDSDEREPDWAPGGGFIVFSSTHGSQRHNIWVIAPDGSLSTQLTFDDADYEQPRFSPQGSSILYLSDHTGKRELWVMNADGSNQRQLAKIDMLVSDPTWSPDGQKIAFVGCVISGPCNVFGLNADGSNGFQITDGKFFLIGTLIGEVRESFSRQIGVAVRGSG